jgi:tetratricopeptide (TPR) repeat protein
LVDQPFVLSFVYVEICAVIKRAKDKTNNKIVSDKNSEQIKLIDSRGGLVRAAIFFAVLLAFVAAYYGVRWQFGQAFAESFVPGSETAAQAAFLATKLAPQNSFAYQISAKVQQGKALSEILAKTESDNENAVRFAPQDYRYWLDLGRARSQNGDAVGGEAALRRAVALSPNYTYPRWFLGNLLLREDRTDEAMREFEKVAVNDSVLRSQVFYLVWERYGGDAEKLKEMFGDTPQVRAALAVFYAGKNLPAESIQMWQSLTDEEKQDNREAGKNALRANFEKGNFHAAAFLVKDLQIEAAEIGKITNGGFEQDTGKMSDIFFNWRIEQIKSLSVSFDLRQPKEGKRSLQLTFSGFVEPTLQAAPQAIAIEPNAKYHLSFAFRTADLKSAGTPFVEVVDLKSSKQIGASQPLPSGTNTNWQTVAFDFSTPPDAQAVLLRINRAFCGANCPIVGAVWFDDFRLEQIDRKEKK